MKWKLSILFFFFAIVVMCGCVQTEPAPTLSPTQVQTPEITATESVPVPQSSFSTSDIYLSKSYTFVNETQNFSEEVRINNASWGIKFDVSPLTDNTIYSWFEMIVTNIQTGQAETYGYGRTNGFELHHLIPGYNAGLYKVEMRGYRVNVKVLFAKRNP
jgi:hypothetical protein